MANTVKIGDTIRTTDGRTGTVSGTMITGPNDFVGEVLVRFGHTAERVGTDSAGTFWTLVLKYDEDDEMRAHLDALSELQQSIDDEYEDNLDAIRGSGR
jgi:hypothetical protein